MLHYENVYGSDNLQICCKEVCSSRSHPEQYTCCFEVGGRLLKGIVKTAGMFKNKIMKFDEKTLAIGNKMCYTMTMRFQAVTELSLESLFY